MRVLVALTVLALTSCVTTVERVEYKLPRGPISIIKHSVQFEDPELRCSGVYIDKDTILTARHCVEDMSLFYMINVDGHQCIASTHKVGKKVDLALLKTEDCRLPCGVTPATIAPNRPAIMEWIWIMGRPVMEPSRPVHGTVCRYDDRVEFNMEIDTGIWPGNSGGGVYNQEGQLVGIINRGLVLYGMPTNFGYAASVDKIHKFLAE